jgi:hypothetical protein
MVYDSPEWRQARDAKLLEWFGGNQSAVNFLVMLSSIAELWDDLIDGDKLPSKEEIDQIFWGALVELPTNEFFQQNKAFFIPLIIQAITAWRDSTVLEKEGERGRAYALTLRDTHLLMAPMIVLLLRGEAAAREVSLEMWKYFTANDDPLAWIGGKSE